MRKISIAALLLFAVVSCKQVASTNSSSGTDENISGVFDRYWEQYAKFFPLDATSQGDNRYNNILPNDQTAAFRDSLKNFFTTSLNDLQKFDREKLNENDKVSYDIFNYEMETRL